MIHIFRSLPFSADARTKRIGSLFDSKKCYYTWEKSDSIPNLDNNNDVHIRFPTNKDKGSKLTRSAFFLFYSLWVGYCILKRARPNDVCVFLDLETIFFGFICARIKKCTVIFDVVDPISQTKVSHPRLKLLANKIEKEYIERAHIATFPHECRVKFYQKPFRKSNHLIIENIPDFQENNLPLQTKIKKNSEKITIGYFGTLDIKNRGLEWLLTLCDKHADKIDVIIGGQGALQSELKLKAGNFNYIGPFSQEILPNLYADIDFTWAYYSPKIELHKYAAPNKYYEHLYFNTPIITSEVIPQSIIIKELKSGLFVDTENDDPTYFSEFIINLFEFNRKKIVLKEYWLKNYDQYYKKKKEELNTLLTRVNS